MKTSNKTMVSTNRQQSNENRNQSYNQQDHEREAVGRIERRAAMGEAVTREECQQVVDYHRKHGGRIADAIREGAKAVTQAEGIKIGDTVRHNKHEEVATVTDIREAFVNRADGYRYLYTLDVGQSVTGPFGVELNGGEFLREAFTPCTPDGRELLPEPPAEVTISTDGEAA